MTHTIIAHVHPAGYPDDGGQYVLPYDGPLVREDIERFIIAHAVADYSVQAGDCTDQDEGYEADETDVCLTCFTVIAGTHTAIEI